MKCHLEPHPLLAIAMAVGLFLVFIFIVAPVSADEAGTEFEHIVDEEDEPGPGTAPSETDELSGLPRLIVLPESEDAKGIEEFAIDIDDVHPEPDEVQPFRILGGEVPPGKLRRMGWYASENSAGLAQAIPVLVAHGKEPGPVLCVAAAVHGDELNGIEIVRNLLYDLNPDKLSGTVVGVPIVNLHGFRQGSRYLADRRDLNRYFPGNPEGSSASRIAYSFFNSIVRHCNYLVDLHTGSFQRTNLPQLRADLNDEGVLHLTRGFGATVVLHGRGPSGSLRRAATEAGIPTVVVEAGEPMRFQPDEVDHGIKALRSLLNHLGMVSTFRLWREPQPTYYQSHWVRADSDGILKSNVKLGQTVKEGDLLGTVTDPITNMRREISSPYDGRILGMALNQTMMPGYAAYHIGIRKTEEEIVEEISLDDVAMDDEDPNEVRHDDLD